MATKIQSYCGLECDKCEYAASCKGCIASGGELPWGTCEIAKCAISKGRRFCGECGEIPCDTLKKYAYNEQFGDNGKRIENCQRIKAELVAEARVGVDPVSVCGHHCDYCFMGKWCGGCRSNYNCCSYATLYDDGVCPDVKCAGQKGFDGCWECEQLAGCEKGYYGQKNEYAAKMAAVFIGKHGKDCYSKTLEKAVAAGVEYAKMFDETGSVESAVKLLEKYI